MKRGRKRKYTFLSCDFETTVYTGQENTEVWASACVELYTEDVKIFHSIDETYDYFISLKTNLVCYYHNLKFDGNFWLWFIMNRTDLKPAVEKVGSGEYDIDWIPVFKMENNTYTYSISDMGQWYNIIIKVSDHIIEIRDSLKLLPFSVKEIGKAFKTKHQKSSMEYSGFRYAGCPITDEEKEYIANDVMVVKEALEEMFNEGHNKLTIGSCCMAEFKSEFREEEYNAFFPDITEYGLDESLFGYSNADKYIRKSYRGGWCYLVKGKENKIYKNGLTADVNSLYPSMMSSESGNRYPYGEPHFWRGNYIPDEALNPDNYYFVRIRTRFKIKPNKLPFIQIKGSWFYMSTDMLETSDWYDEQTGLYHSEYIDLDGTVQQIIPTLTLTCTDYDLILEHYDLSDTEILDGCWFKSVVGIFDKYIEKYKKIKLESTGAKRAQAKLFLNNLYGKMATNTNSSFKYAYMKEDSSIGFVTIVEYNKKAGYIPIGSAITSYARNFTIRAAQKNYHGVDKAGFIYADTDSIHCDLRPEDLVGVPQHDKNFCCWKLESYWDEAIFTRQKTYIEHVTHEDGIEIEKPFYNIRCAGMPERCKQLFMLSMQGYKPKKEDKFSEEELEFLKKRRTIDDFKIGLKVPGKLRPKRIRGGVLLVDTTYEMKE